MERKNLYCIVVANGNHFDTRKSVERLVQNGIEGQRITILDRFSDERLRELVTNEIDYYSVSADEGYAWSLNRIIAESDERENCLLIPAGIWILPGCIEQMYSILEEDENITVISAEHIVGGKYQDVLEQANRKEAGSWEWDYGTTYSHFTTAILLQRKGFEKMGGFDEKFLSIEWMMLDNFLYNISEGNKVVKAKTALVYSNREVFVPKEFYELARIDQKVLREKWGSAYFTLNPNINLLNMMDKTEKVINVLEIGCDCGGNLLGVKNRCKNAILYGVEINTSAAKIASGVAEVLVGNIEEKALTFKEKFDYIIFGDVLEHLRNPEETLKYCRSLLKEDGRILACIPNLMNYLVIRRLLNGYFTYEDAGLLDRTHIHFFTYYELLSTFDKAGYELDEIAFRWPGMLSDEDEKFIDKLLQFSDSTERFMFQTFQYLVSAKAKIV